MIQLLARGVPLCVQNNKVCSAYLQLLGFAAAPLFHPHAVASMMPFSLRLYLTKPQVFCVSLKENNLYRLF